MSNEFWRVVIYIFITFMVLISIIARDTYKYGKIVLDLSVEVNYDRKK